MLPHFAHMHIDSGLRPGAPENIKEPGEVVASTPVEFFPVAQRAAFAPSILMMTIKRR